MATSPADPTMDGTASVSKMQADIDKLSDVLAHRESFLGASGGGAENEPSDTHGDPIENVSQLEEDIAQLSAVLTRTDSETEELQYRVPECRKPDQDPSVRVHGGRPGIFTDTKKVRDAGCMSTALSANGNDVSDLDGTDDRGTLRLESDVHKLPVVHASQESLLATCGMASSFMSSDMVSNAYARPRQPKQDARKTISTLLAAVNPAKEVAGGRGDVLSEQDSEAGTESPCPGGLARKLSRFLETGRSEVSESQRNDETPVGSDTMLVDRTSSLEINVDGMSQNRANFQTEELVESLSKNPKEMPAVSVGVRTSFSGVWLGEEPVPQVLAEELDTGQSEACSISAESSNIDNDLSKLSEFLAHSATGFESDDLDSEKDDELPGMEWEDAVELSQVPASADAMPSELEGDINKLSEALASPAPHVGALAALGPPDPVTTCLPAIARGSQVSEISLRLSSGLDDDIASQDDFVGEDFMDTDIPVNLENCLALNAAYREVVDENMTELQRLLDDNRARQRELNARISEAGGQTTTSGFGAAPRYMWKMFTMGYFSDASGFGPMPNADTVAKTARREYEDMRVSRTWLQSERERLFEAVLVDARRLHSDPARYRVAAIEEKIKEEEALRVPNLETLAAKRMQLKEARDRLVKAESAPVLDVVSECNDDYDWLRIAGTDLDGQRTASECRLQWINFLRPTISHADWSTDEDAIIRAIVELPGANQWKNAVLSLDTGRTPFQVFKRYMALLASKERCLWSNAETQRLLHVVEAVRLGDYVPWPVVAAHMENRTSTQCSSRYQCLKPPTWRGRFTLQEDLRILAAVDEAGITDWGQVAAYLPRRDSRQVHARYSMFMVPGLSRHDWTRDEDVQLVRFIHDNGSKWEEAAAKLASGRNGYLCRGRFMQIQRAFRLKGSLPAAGALAPPFRGDPNGYFHNLRTILKDRLVLRGFPADDMAARKQAALALLNNKGGRSAAIRRAYKRLAPFRPDDPRFKKRQRRQGNLLQLGDILVSSFRLPNISWSQKYAEASLQRIPLTARAWCLRGTDSGVLRGCAQEASPVFSRDAELLADWAANMEATSPIADKDTFSWRHMPLLPVSVASVSMFRSLLLQRKRLEPLIAEPSDSYSLKRRKVYRFNLFASQWASAAMSGTGGAEGTTPWLQPTELTRHRDRMAMVRVTQQEPGTAPRIIALTVAVEETENPARLARRLASQIPDIVKISISRAPRMPVTAESQTGSSDTSTATDAWHLLVARFVSLFFWPALMSLQQPPGSLELDVYKEEDLHIVDVICGNLDIGDDTDVGRAATKRSAKSRPSVDSVIEKRKTYQRECRVTAQTPQECDPSTTNGK